MLSHFERVDSWALALGLIGPGAALRLARADFSTVVDIESNWHRLYYLSKQIGTWLSPFSGAVLHLTEFGIWPSIENRHLVRQVRLSYGESRPIYQVPGHERNQLTASTGSVTATFAYDAQGRRRARTVSGATTNFLYDGQQPIQELTSGNVLSAELLTGGIDELFSRSAGGVTQTFIVDALGSTVRLTDSTGAKVVDYTYEAYGKASNDNASNTNTFQYTGRENDGTQLQFNRARYYVLDWQGSSVKIRLDWLAAITCSAMWAGIRCDTQIQLD